MAECYNTRAEYRRAGFWPGIHSLERDLSVLM